jgi:ERCC4-type nuclease
MVIIIDSREKKLPEIAARIGIPFSVSALEAGDIDCGGGCIIERKSIGDLWASITGPRVDQPLRIAMHPEITYPILGIVGDLTQLYAITSNANPDVVIGFIASCIVRYGFSIIWVPSDEQLLAIANSMHEKIKEGKMGLPPRPVTKIPGVRQIFALTMATRVSPRLAGELLKKFGNLRGVAEAKYEDLIMISGIGPSTAESIINFFNEKPFEKLREMKNEKDLVW